MRLVFHLKAIYPRNKIRIVKRLEGVHRTIHCIEVADRLIGPLETLLAATR